MVEGKRYVDYKDFKEWKKDQEVVINIITSKLGDLSKNFDTFKDSVIADVAEMKGILKVNTRLQWWILGIMSVVFTAAFIAVLLQRVS